MSRSWILLLAGVLALAACGPRAPSSQGADAETPGTGAAQDAPAGAGSELASANTLETARQRWQRLSPDERTTILERYGEFAKLGTNEQHELVQRAQRMRETSQRVQSELPAPVRERLRQLEPEKRREAMREIVGDEARARGQEIRAKLPDVWIDRLESARPEQRPAILAQFRDRHLKRIADFAIDHTGASLGIDSSELRRLKELPLEQRAEAVLELRKRAIERDASENGLPPGLTAEDWRDLVRLTPQEFFTRVQEYRKRRVDSEDAAASEGGPPRDASAPPPDGQAGDVKGGTERMTPERREGLQRLVAAVQQHPEDVIELVDLPKEERRVKLFELRRARCLEIIRAYRLVPPQKIGEMETLGEKRFHEVLRHVLQPLRRNPPGEPSSPREGAPPPKNGARVPESVPGAKEGGSC